jgi:hypothetical protein
MIDNTAPLSPRDTHTSASKLLRQPQIEAAVTTGRQRRSLHLRQRYRRLRIYSMKASRAQRAGIVEPRVSNHSKQQQRVTLKLGELQVQHAGIVEPRVSNHSKQQQRVTLKLGKLHSLVALVVIPKPGPTAEDRQCHEDRCAGARSFRLLKHRAALG